MIGTLAIIFGLSTLVFTLIMSLAGVFDLVTLGIVVVGFNIVQWLISPYIIGALYRAKELKKPLYLKENGKMKINDIKIEQIAYPHYCVILTNVEVLY